MRPEFLNHITKAQGQFVVEGVSSGAEALIFSRAITVRGGIGLYVATDDAAAQRFATSLKFFDPGIDILRLPAWDCLPYDRVGPASEIAALRLATLSRLSSHLAHENLVIVTTSAALLQKTIPKARILSAVFQTKPGRELDMKSLQQYLTTNGYSKTDTVSEKGEYAVRGGVVDLFPPSEALPVRLDLFGDVLESIRTFDPITQRSVKQLHALSLTPVSEAILDQEGVRLFRSRYLEMFGAPQGDPLYESISSQIRRNGMEHWLPFFHEKLATVFEYLGTDPLIFLEHGVLNAANERAALIEDYYQARLAAPPKGSSPYKAINPNLLYLSVDEITAIIGKFQTRELSPFISGQLDSGLNAQSVPARNFAPERQTEGTNVWEAVKQYTYSELAEGKRIVIAAWSDGSAERLGHVLEEHGMDTLFPLPNFGAIEKMPKGAIGLCVLPLEIGFEIDDLIILCEQDILGERLGRARKRRRAGNFLTEASTLSSGDLIVHIDHGIGRYDGLKTLEILGAPHDCLELIYSGGDKLFLPVENIELISRYGSDEAVAQLDKLGGAGWQSRKARAKKKLLEMAAGLIKIAASRAAQITDEVLPPAGLYDEFCAKFPYDETDDQMASIDDVLGDLASGKPMDRLICGDVGFGKTEVALRAAFVVAMSGRQVALVCPTTLLARQHYKTFSERFKGWPIRVRQLSRLVGTKEANETRDGINDGRIDIVVGTHAVLSKQVNFLDLGMVIVDEEQHFGVKHKERLKELRSDTHFLTLTATPIPRTLQMSLSGIREMSVIATPPVDRLAVRTYVTPWDPITIREAILREKYRGGQSFVVAPRIEHLESVQQFLREQIPEITFRTAHGQMPAMQIEPIINAFYDGDFDVLLSTTIVESGLDIPRANTLVVWRADMLGLAAAYQLRGRVGRSKSRAFAYLTIPDGAPITPQATRRLKLLQSLDSLGAGFMLASHDLDMRGGGNLLGEEQSGQIREVGVELYQQMLEEAVAELRVGHASISNKSWSPTISIGLAILIPEDYVPDLNLRLSLYRRLAEISSDEDRESFAVEMVDRFGKMPLEVNQLIEVAGLKALCREAGIEKLVITPNGAIITFKHEFAPEPMKLIGMVQQQPAIYRLRPDGKMMINGNWQSDTQKMKGAKMAIETIISVCA
jgi:transcription-repair coupling factor (superfamily II helicase)